MGTIIPGAIILVNNDLSTTIKNRLMKQLMIDQDFTGEEFDSLLMSNPNFVKDARAARKRILVIRNFQEPNNRRFVDVVIFVKNALAAILQNCFGPPGQTYPVKNLHWGQLCIYSTEINRTCYKCGDLHGGNCIQGYCYEPKDWLFDGCIAAFLMNTATNGEVPNEVSGPSLFLPLTAVVSSGIAQFQPDTVIQDGYINIPLTEATIVTSFDYQNDGYERNLLADGYGFGRNLDNIFGIFDSTQIDGYLSIERILTQGIYFSSSEINYWSSLNITGITETNTHSSSQIIIQAPPSTQTTRLRAIFVYNRQLSEEEKIKLNTWFITKYSPEIIAPSNCGNCYSCPNCGSSDLYPRFCPCGCGQPCRQHLFHTYIRTTGIFGKSCCSIVPCFDYRIYNYQPNETPGTPDYEVGLNCCTVPVGTTCCVNR